MSRRNGADFQSNNWTIDYVEHLRTIHFSLVIVSFGLMICALSYQPEKIHGAATQLEQILFLKSTIESPRDHLTPIVLDQLKPATGVPNFVTVSFSSGVEITFELPLRSAASFEDILDTYPYAKLETLLEFQKMWDAAQTPRQIVLLGEVSSCRVLAPNSEQWINCGPQQISSAHGSAFGDIRWFAQTAGTGFLLRASQPIAPFAREPQIYSFQVQGSGKTFFVDIQKFLTKYFNVPEGSFETSFPLLNEMVEKKDRSRSLQKIYDQLHAEETAKAADFEAFGLHIPPRIVTRFGVFVILAIQWYFLLHVHGLKREFATEAPGWSVAWIGIYGSVAAKITFILSVTLVPASAVIILSRRGIDVGETLFRYGSLLAAGAFSLVVGVMVVLSLPNRGTADRAPLE